MATYIYQCDCGYREEVTHSITTDPIILCSYCDMALSRVPQVTPIRFNGSGWASRETR